MLCLATRSGPTLCDAMVCNLPGSFVLGASPGKNTGVGCLHGIFTIQGLNPGPPHPHPAHCKQIVDWSTRETQESWSVQPLFSRGYSWSRNWTGVSCMAGGFFTHWATREAQDIYKHTEREILRSAEDLLLQAPLKS